MSATRSVNKVAPDGGWGWFVVLGSSILNMFTRAIEPSFGVLFRDLLIDLQVETTGAAVIMGTLDSIVNFCGLFVGPLMKVVTYRQIALIGSSLTAISYFSTTLANSMTHLIISFSIIGGMGFGLVNASTFVALNSFFDKKKAQAVGLAMAGTAMGFTVMPQIVSYLLVHYQFRGTLLILSALTLNTFVGASLFQPVEWHLKAAAEEVPQEGRTLLNTSNTIQEESEEEEVVECAVKIEKEEADRRRGLATSVLALRPNNSVQFLPLKRQNSLVNSLKTSDTALPLRKISQVASTTTLRRKRSMMSHVSLLDFTGSAIHIDFRDEENEPVSKDGSLTKKKRPEWLTRIVKIMDLDLLKDKIYLNILYGASITYVAEFSWKLILPFFMYDLGYTLPQTASALSVMSVADILARVLMPPLLDRLTYSRRSTMIFFLILLAVARSIVAVQTETTPLMIALVVHGFIRGVTLIGFPLVLSEYATKDNFPAVLGLSMVAKGIFIAVIAPIFGWVRDYTQNFSYSIHFQSAMILSCVVAWGLEYLLVRKGHSVASDAA